MPQPLQAQPAETVTLSVNDVSGALQRKHGGEGVPENVAGVLRSDVPLNLCAELRA